MAKLHRHINPKKESVEMESIINLEVAKTERDNAIQTLEHNSALLLSFSSSNLKRKRSINTANSPVGTSLEEEKKKKKKKKKKSCSTENNYDSTSSGNCDATLSATIGTDTLLSSSTILPAYLPSSGYGNYGLNVTPIAPALSCSALQDTTLKSESAPDKDKKNLQQHDISYCSNEMICNTIERRLLLREGPGFGKERIAALIRQQLKHRSIKFPLKLMYALDECLDLHMGSIAWSPDGRSFSIPNPDFFESVVLSEIFKKEVKFSSFLRKLYRWGFLKTKKRTARFLSYTHPQFQRGNYLLCMGMNLCASTPKPCRNNNPKSNVIVKKDSDDAEKLRKKKALPNTKSPQKCLSAVHPPLSENNHLHSSSSLSSQIDYKLHDLNYNEESKYIYDVPDGTNTLESQPPHSSDQIKSPMPSSWSTHMNNPQNNGFIHQKSATSDAFTITTVVSDDHSTHGSRLVSDDPSAHGSCRELQPNTSQSDLSIHSYSRLNTTYLQEPISDVCLSHSNDAQSNSISYDPALSPTSFPWLASNIKIEDLNSDLVGKGVIDLDPLTVPLSPAEEIEANKDILSKFHEGLFS